MEHRHRATTSRYYSDEQLSAILELNYLRFLTGAVADPKLFGRLWREAIERLRLLQAYEALRFAWRAPLLTSAPVAVALNETEFLALTHGDVAVFPGRACSGRLAKVVTSPGLATSDDSDLVLICRVEKVETPPLELLQKYAEVVLVRQSASPAFDAAMRQTKRKWQGD